MRSLARVVLTVMTVAVVGGCKKEDRPVWNGPFGLEEGLLFETYVKDYDTTDKTPGKMLYESQDVPKPEKWFRHYQLAFDPDAGLCRVVAHGRTIDVSPDGRQLIKNYQEITNELVKIYGPQTDSFDYVDPDSELSASDQWMTSLHREQRVLGGYWLDGKRIRGAQGAILRLPNDIESITVGARAFSENSGAVEVGFQFKNYGQCVLSARLGGVDLQSQ